MPRVIVDSSKGLYQSSGIGFGSKVSDLGAITAGTYVFTELVTFAQPTGNITVSTANASAGDIRICVNNGGNTVTLNGVSSWSAGTVAIIVYDGSAWIEMISA